jgi:hypothetical protein
VQQTIDITLQKTTSLLESFGMPESEMEKIYDEMEKQRSEIANSFTLTGMISNYFTSLFMGAILCAIAALITRRNDPKPFDA